LLKEINLSLIDIILNVVLLKHDTVNKAPSSFYQSSSVYQVSQYLSFRIFLLSCSRKKWRFFWDWKSLFCF